MRARVLQSGRRSNQEYLSYLTAKRVTRGSDYPKRHWVHESKPMFQKAFKHWLRQAQPRIGVPLKIVGLSKRHIKVVFDGYPSCLSIAVRPSEISVAVEWDREVVDLICDFDMSSPVMVNGKIFCEFCLPKYIVHYTTLEGYWRGHQFERFADWINKQLAPARWLVIYHNFARLHVEKPATDPDLLALIELPVPSLPGFQERDGQPGKRERI